MNLNKFLLYIQIAIFGIYLNTFQVPTFFIVQVIKTNNIVILVIINLGLLSNIEVSLDFVPLSH